MSSEASWSYASARPEITLPWTDVAFQVNRLTGVERVSGLFSIDVEIEPLDPHSFDPAAVSSNEIVGQEAVVRLIRGGAGGGEQLRFWHGLVEQITMVPAEEARRPHVQRLRLVPWLALWNLATSCRMYEEVTVTDVIQDLAGAWNQGHRLEQRLSGGYEPRRYCCQFVETDFNFLSRLLEEEGIFYYFDHGPSGHQMVLADRVSLAGASNPLVVDLGIDVTHWKADYRLHSGSFAVRDYDEYSANVRQAQETTIHSAAIQAGWERLEYPGRAVTSSQADQRARVGMEREETRQATYRGVSSEPRLMAGHRMSLRAAENRAMEGEYFLTSLEHAYDARFGYRNSLSAVRSDSQASYRPPRSAAKPVIFGPQTAIVTNEPPGENMPGMVQVRFPWDKSEADSCWIRFAEMMADDGWGTWFPPHAEQEVLVEFLNGDPDRPVVTGRMYNGRKTPAENNVHITAIRTEQGQELRFDDHAGAEEVVLRGTRNVQVLAGPGTLVIKDQAGNEIELSPQGGIHVRSSSTVKVTGASIELTAGMVTINAGMTRASGVLQCGTLITNAVVSATYTPGAGNIW